MARRSTLLPALLACLAMVLALAGCNSSGSSTDDTVSTTPITDSTVAPTDAPTTSPDTETPDPDITLGGDDDVVDACTLLSGDDVVSAGGKAGVHKPDSFNGTDGCNYGAVSVFVGFTQSAFDGYADGTDVQGVGDKAVYESDWHRIWVQASDSRFMVSCKLCSSDTEQATLEDLAKTVVGKLL